MSEQLVLAADVGATHTRFRLEAVGERSRVVDQSAFTNAEAAGFEQLVEAYLQLEEVASALHVVRNISSVCIGVAGPTDGLSVRLTNLPWEIDVRSVGRRFGFGSVRLVNDVQAAGYGVGALGSGDVHRLQAGGLIPGATRAVVAPGTGLGVSYATNQPSGYNAYASEAGHCDFAPNDTLQQELLDYLHGRYGHVSYERILSGHGLVNLFDFLVVRKHSTVSSELVRRIQEGGAPALTRAALDEGHVLAKHALTLFVSVLGAFCGNLALTLMPRGGLYICGGIPQKIMPAMTDGTFLNGFSSKGRFGDFMGSFPVFLVPSANPSLLGAAMLARRFLS